MQQQNLSDRELEILRHMVGAGSKNPGYRNFFCASLDGSDFLVLNDLMKKGLVFKGRTISGCRDCYFHATEAGMRAAGLTDDQINFCMEP